MRRWLGHLAARTVGLNAADALFTWYWVATGQALEANPAMAGLLSQPMAFGLVKSALVLLGLALLVIRRKHPCAAAGIVGVFVAYCAVFFYHLHAVGSF